MGAESEQNKDGEKNFKFPEEDKGGGGERDDLGGYTTKEFDAMKDNPETADHARGIIEQRDHLERVEDNERDRAWRKKYPQFAQVEQTKKGLQFPSSFSTLKDAVKHSLSPSSSDIHETMWYDVEEMLQSKTAPEDLIDAALEHPSHFVPKAAAENYRLTSEQFAKILSRDDMDLIEEACLEGQKRQGMTPEEIKQAQELAGTELSNKESK